MSTQPKTILCDVSREVDRFDLRVGETTYLLCAVHGLGGVRNGNATQLAIFLRWLRGADVRVYTQLHAWGDQVVVVPANEIEILRHVPRSEVSRG